MVARVYTRVQCAACARRVEPWLLAWRQLGCLVSMSISQPMPAIASGVWFQARKRAICYSENLNKHFQAHTVRYGRMLVNSNVARCAVSCIVHTQRLQRHEKKGSNLAMVDVLGRSFEKRCVLNVALYLC
eukprot:IDg10155t1